MTQDGATVLQLGRQSETPSQKNKIKIKGGRYSESSGRAKNGISRGRLSLKRNNTGLDRNRAFGKEIRILRFLMNLIMINDRNEG